MNILYSKKQTPRNSLEYAKIEFTMHWKQTRVIGYVNLSPSLPYGTLVLRSDEMSKETQG